MFVKAWSREIKRRIWGRPESLRFRLARDTLGVMALRALARGLGFLMSVLLARLLGVREFGLYAFAMSLLELLSAPAAFGFPLLLVREIAAYRTKGEWGSIQALLYFSQRVTLGASLGLALLMGLGLWLLSDRLLPGAEVTLGLALTALPFMALAQLKGSALRGLDRILEGQVVNGILRPLSFLALITVMWLLGRTLLDAAVAVGLQALAAGVTLLIGGFLLHRHLGAQVSETSLIPSNLLWLRSALWLLLLTLLDLLPRHSGVLFLGIMRRAEEVGLYKVAYQTASLIPFGLMAVNTVIAPTLSHLYASGKYKRLQRVVMAAGGAALLFALPLVLLFLLGGAEFLRVTFGEAFALSGRALTILTLGQIVNVATGPVGMLLVMSGHEREAAFNALIAVVTNIVLHLMLIPLFGVVGAAIASATTMVTVNLLSLYVVARRLGIFSFIPSF